MSQSKYVNNVVKKFGLERERHNSTPVVTHIMLAKDDQGTDINQSHYRNMIGSLLYLTSSLLDITFSIGVRDSYQTKPKVSHLTRVKRIIKYINGTGDYDIIYSCDTNSG